MHPRRFDRVCRAAAAGPSRRALLAGMTGGLSATIVGLLDGEVAARKKRKKKKKKETCKAPNCIEAPFTIEASWSNRDDDHDTIFYVPNLRGSSVPNPFIDIFCTPPEVLPNGNAYPFAFLNEDATGPGPEIITVKKLLTGRYEYWLQLDAATRENTVLVRLVKNGQIRRVWSNPTGGVGEDEWRVFAITVRNGKGNVQSLDEFPAEFPEDETRLCE